MSSVVKPSDIDCSTKRSSNNTYEFTEEINLFELINSMWQARKFALIGAACGLALALLYSLVSTNSYKTKVPVSIDITSLPAITEAKLVVDTFNSALGSPAVATAAVTAMLTESKEFAAALKSAKLKPEDLISEQVMQDAGKRTSVPIRLVAGISSTEYFVETKFGIKGLGDKAPQAILAAINAAGKAFNSSIWEQKRISAVGIEKDLLGSYKTLQQKMEPVLAEQTTTQLSIRSALAQIEYELEREVVKAGIKVPQTTDLILDVSGSDRQVNGSASGVVLEKQLMRILRLKSALSTEGKIGVERLKTIDTRLSDIQRKAELLTNEFYPLLNSIKAMQTQIAETQKEIALPVDRKNMVLPLFKNYQMYSENYSNPASWEVSSFSFRLALLGGLFLGAILGIFTYLADVFYINNKEKFKFDKSV